VIAPLGPGTLPANDNINPYAFCVDVRASSGSSGPAGSSGTGEWFMQKGKMIAYYGQLRFTPLTAVASQAAMVAARFSSPLYVSDWVLAAGSGQLLLGDRGYDLNSFNLDDGNLTIRAANLLAFETRLELKQSIVPGFLSLLGTGRFVASSNGPVMFVEPPMRVDPQALVGWADCPSPAHHFDATWMQGFLGQAGALLGRQSGEERQLDFTGAGTVLMQSSEAVREDPALLRDVIAQTESLTVAQQAQLAALLSQRVANR
jgi:hypothetical protein